MKNNFDSIQVIYFLGIGGIGMSALARFFNTQGKQIYGYDKTPSDLTDQLISEGMTIHFNEDLQAIPSQVDMVIYTPAIPAAHKELCWFQDNGVRLYKRSEVLGMLTKSYYTIAVAGTHGKTSITSLVAHILHSAGKQVTAFIGGITKNFKSNLLLAKNTEFIVVEADEYDRSFHALYPDIAVISAIDADHLDIYGSMSAVQESFYQFASQVKENGRLIVKKNVPMPVKFFGKLDAYGILDGKYRAKDIEIKNHAYTFTLVLDKDTVQNVTMLVPGRHTIENAIAASAVAHQLGVAAEVIADALRTYSGVERRFDYRVRTERIVFIDDYAHHPEELKAAIMSVKELYAGRKITGIFQPHLYTRTRDFADDFAKSLDLLDEAILMDIYPARELPIAGVTSEMLIERMTIEKKYKVANNDILPLLEKLQPEVLLTLGAGDIDRLVPVIQEWIEQKM